MDGLAQQDSCECEDENDIVGRYHQHSTGPFGFPPMPDPDPLRISDFFHRIKGSNILTNVSLFQGIRIRVEAKQANEAASAQKLTTIAPLVKWCRPDRPALMTIPRHPRKISNSCSILLQQDERNILVWISNKNETGRVYF